MQLKKGAIISAVALTISLALSNVYAANSTTITSATDKNVQLDFMFVQNAYQASLNKTKKANMYTLTLKDVAPYVTYFSDKPKRIAGTFTIEDYLKNWQLNQQTQTKDAPNADLVGSYHHNGQHEMANLVVELKKPQYNATNRTLTYKVKILDQSINNDMLTKPIKHIALFIDNGWCPGCDHGGLGLAY